MTVKEHIVRETLRADGDCISTTMSDVGFVVMGLLDNKGQEYSSDVNRFENFLETARMEGIAPEEALWRFMLKHIISIKKFIKELDSPVRRPPDMWDEKICDIIAYLIILKAMVRKREEIETKVDANRDDDDGQRASKLKAGECKGTSEEGDSPDK